jgi:hypothetical protein
VLGEDVDLCVLTFHREQDAGATRDPLFDPAVPHDRLELAPIAI